MNWSTCFERHHYEILLRQPLHGVFAGAVKTFTKPVGISGLIRRSVIRDDHALWVAAAHVVLGVIHCHPVAAAGHGGLCDGLSVDVVVNGELGAAFRP